MRSPRAIRALLVLVAFLCALGLRSIFSYHIVFRGDEVVFQDPDAAFHVRTIQNLVRHFPYRSGFDPYSGFPHGQDIDTGPFHDYAIGTIAWLAGSGAPSRYLTNVVAAWFPAVLGSLAVMPVYLLGCNLFSPAAGLIASGLIAILPGSFLWMTRLGAPDHHVTEALLSTLLLLLLVKALQPDCDRRLIVLAGLVLGCYLITQAAGVLIVLFVEIWAILQIISNQLRDKRSRQIWLVTVPPLFTGWLIFTLAGPNVWSEFTTLILWGGILGISGTLALAEWQRVPRLFLLTLAGVAAAGLTAVVAVKPDLIQEAIRTITYRAMGPAQTVGELRPLLTATGNFSLKPVWEQFTTCWFLAPAALVYVAWRAWKENSPAHLLFAVWSALMMAASFQYIRNCYYLAVNIALLSGVACVHLVRLDRRYERIAAAVLVGAALLIPNISLAYPFVKADTGPSADWLGALAFLREQTPEPFADPNTFDQHFPRRQPEDLFPYPKSAYGVLSWWDFGHWITAFGRRMAIANGMQTGATDAARFFTATDPAEAAAILRSTGARYVVADASLALGSPKVLSPSVGSFASMTTWAARNPNLYWENYDSGPDGAVFQVFYPAYYQSMLARLYLFDGQPQTPAASTWVIQYAEETVNGQVRKRLTGTMPFRTYAEAELYLREHPSANTRIGGLDPLRSCIPLSGLDGFRRVYSSQPGTSAGQPLRAVKIFRHTP